MLVFMLIGGYKFGQIVLFDWGIVLGIELVAVIIGLQEYHPLGRSSPLEEQYRGFNA